MKKILFTFLLATSLFLTSCSNDDSDNQNINTTEYSKIIINGVTYNDNNPTVIEYGANSCSSTDLRAGYFGEFYTSNFDIGLYFVHKEFYDDFQGYNISNSSFKYADLVFNSECYNNFDVIMDYYDLVNDEDLTLDTSYSNSSSIQSCNKISEDDSEATYMVKGTFSCRFKRSDNSTVTITGEYNRKIFLIK